MKSVALVDQAILINGVLFRLCWDSRSWMSLVLLAVEVAEAAEVG